MSDVEVGEIMAQVTERLPVAMSLLLWEWRRLAESTRPESQRREI